MNALSCSYEGQVWDYFDGIADARAGRVRVVGDPRARIAEDYLRLLRFFRFLAHYGREEPDREALTAASEAAPQLSRLSGERIRDELLRLLCAQDPIPSLRLMQKHRILAAVLPELALPSRLAHLLLLHPEADPLLRLAAVLPGGAQEAGQVAERLRLSNAQATRLMALALPPVAVRPGMERAALRAALYRHGREMLIDWLYLAASREEIPEDGRSSLQESLAMLESQPQLRFPIRGRDLLSLGASSGPALGRLLRDLED